MVSGRDFRAEEPNGQQKAEILIVITDVLRAERVLLRKRQTDQIRHRRNHERRAQQVLRNRRGDEAADGAAGRPPDTIYILRHHKG